MIKDRKVDIKKMFTALDEEMEHKLHTKIDQVLHTTTKGTESELNWINFLKSYLPERYKVDSGFVIDCEGNHSHQIDIIVYDRHFTPFVFRGESVLYIPREGVYAVFEVKQNLTKEHYDDAVEKLKSVNDLKCTSVSYNHLGSQQNIRKPFDVMGGLLSCRCDSVDIFNKHSTDLVFLISLQYGVSFYNGSEKLSKINKPFLSFFLLHLMNILRTKASVPALDIEEYLKNIKDLEPKIHFI